MAILASLGEATIFTGSDIKAGFHNIPMAPGEEKYTAFIYYYTRRVMVLETDAIRVERSSSAFPKHGVDSSEAKWGEKCGCLFR